MARSGSLLTRRSFVCSSLAGSLLLRGLLSDLLAVEATPGNPLAPKAPHFPAILFLNPRPRPPCPICIKQ